MSIKKQKNWFKNFASKMAIVVICGIFLSNSFGFSIHKVYAEEYYDSDIYDENGNLRVGKCIQKCSMDFSAFLGALLWSDSFAESVVEPLKDVLSRNTCQAFDILSLVQQSDKLRKQIRDAFLTCRNDKVPALKKAYYKTVVEIYFARNVVYGSFLAKKLTDIDQLATELTDKYVYDYNWFTPEEFDVFVNELKLRYLDRRTAYIDECEETSWSDVRDKFKEFIETFKEDVQKGVTGIKRQSEKIEKTFGDSKSWEEWAKGLTQVNINGQSPGDFWEEFSDEFDENNPFTSTNFPSTTEGVFEVRKQSDFILQQKALKDEMSSRFQMLYGSAGDSNLQLFIDSINQLNQAIIDSYDPLNSIKECAKTMNKKQCE